MNKKIAIRLALTAGVILALFVACGGVDIIDCDGMKDRCEQKCADLGMAAVTGTCIQYPGAHPRMDCSCVPMGDFTDPAETQGMGW